MKRLVLFFAAVLFTAISANVFAQNTGTSPTPGSTWNYSVTDNGNDYEWSVTKGDLTTDGDADVTYNPLSADGASVDITWDAGVVGDIYYVHILETDANLCSNEKVLKVTITASNFYLTIAAVNATACYDAAVSVTLDGSGDPVYNHGNATVSYTVSPTGNGTDTYSFDYAEVFDQANLTSTPSVTSGNGNISGTTVNVTDANAVTLQFVVANGNTYTNANDSAGNAADFNQTITHSSGITSHGVTDNGSGTASDDVDVARPHTTTIGSN